MAIYFRPQNDFWNIKGSFNLLYKRPLFFSNECCVWDQQQQKQFRFQLERSLGCPLKNERLFWLQNLNDSYVNCQGQFSKACYILSTCLPQVRWSNLSITDVSEIAPGDLIVTYSESFLQSADDAIKCEYSLHIWQAVPLMITPD